jgi:Amt family ammonium transporter
MAFEPVLLQERHVAGAWMCVEWWNAGRPTTLGFACGMVAGLVAITPSAGHVSPVAAVIIGMLGGIVCLIDRTTGFSVGQTHRRGTSILPSTARLPTT